MASSGVAALDKLLGDGYPDRSAVLVVGPPGMGKDALGYRFTRTGLLEGDFCLYVTRLAVREVLHDVRGFGIDMQQKVPLWLASDGGQIKYEVNDLAGLSYNVKELLKQNASRRIRIVTDVLSSLLMLNQPETIYKFLTQLLEDVKRCDAILLATLEEGMHGPEVTASQRLPPSPASPKGLQPQATKYRGGTGAPAMKNVVDWLTEPDQPAVRYLAMRDLLESSAGDLKEAKKTIPESGWVKQIHEKRLPDGHWAHNEEALYRPKYLSTNWMLLILSDLGVTKEVPWVAESAELWRDTYARADGGFDSPGAEKSELCLVGNTARGLVNLGYEDDPKVRRAFGWLVKNQRPNGGWDCWDRNGVIDGWEGMSAFAAYPREKWTRGTKQAIERGLEFYLERSLLHEGARWDPWYRLHFPYHYYYDVLVGLEFVTALGGGDDPRAAHAIRLLKRKRLKDGRWAMDAVHPDALNAGKLPKWFAKYKREIKPFSLEAVGEPSKMITLRALRVLKRLGEPMPC